MFQRWKEYKRVMEKHFSVDAKSLIKEYHFYQWKKLAFFYRIRKKIEQEIE